MQSGHFRARYRRCASLTRASALATVSTCPLWRLKEPERVTKTCKAPSVNPCRNLAFTRKGLSTAKLKPFMLQHDNVKNTSRQAMDAKSSHLLSSGRDAWPEGIAAAKRWCVRRVIKTAPEATIYSIHSISSLQSLQLSFDPLFICFCFLFITAGLSFVHISTSRFIA